MDAVAQLFAIFVSLGGFGSLIAGIVNVLKLFKVVSDGQSATWSTGLNLLGVVGLFLLGIFAPAADIAGLDATAGQVAQLLTVAAGLVFQLWASRKTHEQLRGVPVIGKSFSAKA